MIENVFVLGLDELNLETLQRLPEAESLRFLPLLDIETMQEGDIDLPKLLDKATAQLEAFDEPISAVIGYWDFPVSSMVPLLAERFGLRGPSLESVAKCEHKYWSRLEQRKVIDEVPRFGIVDLDADAGDARLPEGLSYPVWLKPVKSFSSELAFHVGDDAEFDDAVAQIREGVGRVGSAFDDVLAHLELPPEIAEVGGQACLAEEEITGAQITVEGYRYDGRTHVYGVVDSITYPDSPSFLRYQYPSRLPAPLLDRVTRVSATVVEHLGLDNTAFNIEFFVDTDRDTVSLLEINPRISQSHDRLFEHVDGVANHLGMVRLALGRDPDLPHRAGEYAVSAKWFLRHWVDGTVRRAPTDEEVAAAERAVPGTTIDLVAGDGDRLSELEGQDSYSYELADLYIGADSEAQLVAKYEKCIRLLPFEVE